MSIESFNCFCEASRNIKCEVMINYSHAEIKLQTNNRTFMVGAKPEEKELFLEDPNDEVPVASIWVSSLFSSKFVMVASTQFVFAAQSQNIIVSAW